MALGPKHPYHLVENSPWPFLLSWSIFFLAVGFVGYVHRSPGSGYLLLLPLALVVYFFSAWVSDINFESTYQLRHNSTVIRGLKLGFALFIVSEIMFFFSFFWALYHFGIYPTIQIGSQWPPAGIHTIDPFHLPLSNTFILLTSGFWLTLSHWSLLGADDKNQFEFPPVLSTSFPILNSSYVRFLAPAIFLLITVIFAFTFLLVQLFEYSHSPFSISDGVYGSVFFMLTGLHGLHVFGGTIALSVCLAKLLLGHFDFDHHVSYECSIWYWHFVDVVWLFLYFLLYIPGLR